MSLFSELEKFGSKSSEKVQMETQKNETTNKESKIETDKEEKIVKKIVPPEKDFILPKTTECKVCGHVFKTKTIKSGKVRRLQPDRDLRPRYQYIDALKYDIISCPVCGYSAMTRDFDRISSAQAKLIKEKISANFSRVEKEGQEVYSYDAAIERYKLSLLNTIVKKGKESEKAYTCLKIAWLYRGKADTLSDNIPEEKTAKEECQKNEETFYFQAYEGLTKAISQEMFPICGMEESTVDYLLAYMAFHFKQNEIASKFLGSVLTSPTASRRMKDLALDLKEDIITELKRK